MTDSSIEWLQNPDGSEGKSWGANGLPSVAWSPELVTRFAGYVEARGEDECWPWRAGRFDKGYGQFRLGTRKVKASRCALELTLGRELAPGMRALHTCDNPPCCNPRHLFEGTDADNAADREAKGRGVATPLPGRPGASNPSARITVEIVLAIREAAARGVLPRENARVHGLSTSQVRNIVHGRCWKEGPWPQHP